MKILTDRQIEAQIRARVKQNFVFGGPKIHVFDDRGMNKRRAMRAEYYIEAVAVRNAKLKWKEHKRK